MACYSHVKDYPQSLHASAGESLFTSISHAAVYEAAYSGMLQNLFNDGSIDCVSGLDILEALDQTFKDNTFKVLPPMGMGNIGPALPSIPWSPGSSLAGIQVQVSDNTYRFGYRYYRDEAGVGPISYESFVEGVWVEPSTSEAAIISSFEEIVTGSALLGSMPDFNYDYVASSLGLEWYYCVLPSCGTGPIPGGKKTGFISTNPADRDPVEQNATLPQSNTFVWFANHARMLPPVKLR